MIEPFLHLSLIIGKVNRFLCHMICTTCHMFLYVGLIEVITCFYLKLTLLYIDIMPDEDLWVETLLLINSFGAAIFSVWTFDINT